MSDTLDGVIAEARSVVDQIDKASERVIRDVRQYLASPQGRRVRETVAWGLLTAAPAVAATPIFRRTLLVRILGVAGAATVVVKVAEAIRDWEPAPAGELSGAGE